MFRNAMVRTVLVLCVMQVPSSGIAQQNVQRDLTWIRRGDRELKLDIYQAGSYAEADRPLVIWIHGGAWRAGSKDHVPILGWLKHGFAIASVEYRLSPEAKFPAQLHDLHAAIRFCRRNAGRYGFDPQRFVVAGASAGGHLAALTGVSSDVPELLGREDSNADSKGESSGVQAIVSFYGASNLQTILSQSTPHGLSVRVPALQLLLGGQPDEKVTLARLASPVVHVDSDDPPLWLIHGDADPQMPPQQSLELKQVYEKHGCAVTLQMLPGSVHGGAEFYSAVRLAELADQLHVVLRTPDEILRQGR